MVGWGDPESMGGHRSQENKVVKGRGRHQTKSNKNRCDHCSIEPMEVTGDPWRNHYIFQNIWHRTETGSHSSLLNATIFKSLKFL